MEISVLAIVSEPPPGKCRVVNIFVNPVTRKLEVEYDETPEKGG
jgi:hypothetical protein